MYICHNGPRAVQTKLEKLGADVGEPL